MKGKQSIVLIMLLPLFLIGCSEKLSGHSLSLKQEDIAKEFYTNPSAAKDKYKEVWRAHSVDAVDPVTMAIAGELMFADSASYDDYYRYVMGGLASKDETVILASIRALQNAHGVESIRALFDLSKSSNEAIAHTAVGAIKYRYTTAKKTSSLSDEAEYIREQIRLLKAQP